MNQNPKFKPRIRRLQELGRVALPTEFLDKIEIKTRDYLEISLQGNEIVIGKVRLKTRSKQ